MWLVAVLSFTSVLLAALWVRDLSRIPQRQVELVFGDAGPGAADAGPARAGGGLRRLEADARKSGVPLTVLQFLALTVVVGLLGAGLAYTLIPRWYMGLMGAALGLFAPRWLLARARRVRAEAFSRALDGALGQIASYLRAGRSLEQAVQLVAAESEEPVRTELQRAAQAISLGATAAAALGEVARRVDSRDFELVVVSVSILTRTGGNLAEVLQRIARQIQERRLARQAVLAATTQVRMTAYVITAMPFFLTVMMRMLNPDFFAPMLDTTAGQVVMVACFAAVGVAWLWIRQMLQVAVD